TIRNGRVTGMFGGGIANLGNLTLNRVIVSDNASATSAGGIFNGGNGVLTLHDVWLHDNSATSAGGALFNYGTALLMQVTLSANSATNGGGGAIANVANPNNSLSLINVTISDNPSPGAGTVTNSGTLNMTNVTLADGAGVASAARLVNSLAVDGVPGRVTLRNTILSGAAGANCTGSARNTIVSGGHNLD